MEVQDVESQSYDQEGECQTLTCMFVIHDDPFSIITCSGIAGQVTLTWDAPTTNADGTPLSNFNGAYRIYYGTSTGNYTQTTNLTNTNSVVTCPVTNLTDNQAYYFVVTAVNTLGNESQYSNEVSKVAQPAGAADRLHRQYH